jgi:cystathionine beta-lyase
MTHAAMPREMRLKAGITDGLVRVSIGCEEIADLLTDFAEALDKV